MTLGYLFDTRASFPFISADIMSQTLGIRFHEAYDIPDISSADRIIVIPEGFIKEQRGIYNE